MKNMPHLDQTLCIAKPRMSKPGMFTPGTREPGTDETRSIDETRSTDRFRAECGQTTAEYALVLLAAGSIAMLVVAWAQGNDAIGSLFDTVLSRITSLTA